MPDVLKQPLIDRQKFDPTNAAHIASFEVFMRTGNWGHIQFFSELPYNEVPMTVLMKYAEFKSGITRESAAERNTRIGAKPNIIRMPAPMNPGQERARRNAELAELNERFLPQVEAMFAKA